MLESTHPPERTSYIGPLSHPSSHPANPLAAPIRHTSLSSVESRNEAWRRFSARGLRDQDTLCCGQARYLEK